MKPKSHITRITVSRLYNLGNYEHIRYELTADVPYGCSAKLAMSKLVKILQGANPKPPFSRVEYEKAKTSISKPLSKMDAYDHDNANYYRRTIDLVDKWNEGQKKALDLLHRFGGTADHKDAKLDWENTPW